MARCEASPYQLADPKAAKEQVPAEFHPTGALVGRIVIAPTSHARSLLGECPVPVAMPLHRPTARTDPQLIVVDDLYERWVMGFSIHYLRQLYRITGFYSQ
ncbi:hypothetical protein GCM10011583_71680 [Streptomyces camponoticapitis]|uniref:Uncharacterized protein n=1 Tax=Streptomyces camponoticapitis TaxID=1616125 RepID=A0ABQ2EZ80_9ACTN|nr:hypothetical protein [Streptomyces camponoticapitis]GGK29399.1 hypothetical protein GCM10011583_71680 [Streptomyces camponoticapitis]